ncbi:MAG: LysR family transcriptional regulator [Pseudomonadota bacterium]
MRNFDWDDLRVFLAIHREGNLSAAARELRISQPTAGRRLANLESSLSARLFDRLPEGLAATAAGTELLDMAEQMEKAADSVMRRQRSFADTISGSVRISVFEQTSAFLTDHLHLIREKLPDVDLEISVAHIGANLSRREADLLIRECRPDSPGLIARRLGNLAHAVYASRDYANRHPEAFTEKRFEVCDWIGPDDEHLYFSGQKWLREKMKDRLPRLRCNNGIVFYDAVRKHAGLAVLPCFIGDTDDALIRVSDVLPSASAAHFLIVHQDLRNVPAVRALMDILIELYDNQKELLSGEHLRSRDAA